jgi:DMSO/TMAO reductase YedYZ heme-binding membrane subunit
MEDQKLNAFLMWLKTDMFGCLVFLVGLGYMYLYRGTIDVAVLSENLALTGGILIGLSFALSGITFFYNFLDSKLKYRKYIGLLGYYFAVAYTITLIVRFPDLYWNQLPVSVLTWEALLGITAMAILSFMAIISQNWAALRLGKHWRPLLRLGYLAYAVLILRAIIIEAPGWSLWAESFKTVPPPRLLLTIYALLVILLRVVLEIALQKKKRAIPQSSPSKAIQPTAVTDASIQSVQPTISYSDQKNVL